MNETRVWEAITAVTGGSKPVALSVEEFSRLLGLSRGAVYKPIRCGDIQAVKILTTIRIPVSEVFRTQLSKSRIAAEPLPSKALREFIIDLDC